MAAYAVERSYSSGCWDSNGHEILRTHRYQCGDSFQSAQERFLRVLSDPLTRKARIVRLNERTGRYECVASGDHPRGSSSDLSPPVGTIGRPTVQSVLFRWASR